MVERCDWSRRVVPFGELIEMESPLIGGGIESFGTFRQGHC
jgi:hypothetical protein